MTRWSIHLSASACPLISQCSSKRLPRATARAAPFKKDKLFCPCSPFGMRVPLSVLLFPFQRAAPWSAFAAKKPLPRKPREGSISTYAIQCVGWYRKARECGKCPQAHGKHKYTRKKTSTFNPVLRHSPAVGYTPQLLYGPKEYTRRELIRSSQPIVLFSWLWKYSAEQIMCSRPVRTWYQKASPVAGFYIMKSLYHAPYSDVLSPRHHTFPFNSTLSWNNFNVGEGVLYLYPCLHSCNG